MGRLTRVQLKRLTDLMSNERESIKSNAGHQGIVKDMDKHMRGETVMGALARNFPELDFRAIRQRTGMLQTCFAFLIVLKPQTLENWEQRSEHPAGPERALLKIVGANPWNLSALHA
jgi:putative transcriptional regulator